MSKLIAGTQTPFALASLGVSVRAGAPKPDIGTVEAYKAALLAAKSIGYSFGCSGLHVAEGIEKLGLTEALKAKTVRTGSGAGGGPVTDYLARGDVEIGIQQTNIMVGVPGTDYVGVPPGFLNNPCQADVAVMKASKRNRGGARHDLFHGFVGRRAPPAQNPCRAVQVLDLSSVKGTCGSSNTLTKTQTGRQTCHCKRPGSSYSILSHADGIAVGTSLMRGAAAGACVDRIARFSVRLERVAKCRLPDESWRAQSGVLELSLRSRSSLSPHSRWYLVSPRDTEPCWVFYMGIVATAIAHRYWEYPQAQQLIQYTNFTKNVAIAGGLLLVFVNGAGRFGIDPILSGKGRSRCLPVSCAGREPRGPCAPRTPCSRRRIGECPRASAPAPDWTARPGSAGRARRTAWCPRTATAP